MGLREAKKAHTRRLIAGVAHELFTERGFERTTVAEVARRAEVAEATVFNYFPTKEDLFYAGLEAYGTDLVDAVRDRPDGESPAAAFARCLLDGPPGQMDRIADGDAEALDRLRAAHRVISSSPALQAREHQVLARSADALAEVLRAEGAADDDPTPEVLANALFGVHRALIAHTRSRLLADDRPERLAADLRERGGRAFALLGRGLGDTGPAVSSG